MRARAIRSETEREPLLRVWEIGQRRETTRGRLGIFAALLLHASILGWAASGAKSAPTDAQTTSTLVEISIATESDNVAPAQGSAIGGNSGPASGSARKAETQAARPSNDLLKRLVEMYGSDITAPVSIDRNAIGDEAMPGDALDQGADLGSGAGSGTGAGSGRGAGSGTGDGAGKTGSTPRSRPNLSRSASLGSDSVWNCDSPAASLVDQVVRLVVMVRPDGTAASAEVVFDPGSGFGKAARDCALKHRFSPARDADGKPVLGPTASFGVRFRY